MIQSKDIIQSRLAPCCVLNHPNYNSVFIVGCYDLSEKGIRKGSIEVYLYENQKLKLLFEYLTDDSVLDLKISANKLLLVVAHLNGNVGLWSLSLNSPELIFQNNVNVFDNKSLVTSVNFLNFENKFIATLTSGKISMIDTEKFNLELFHTEHELECWIGLNGYFDIFSNVVFTGGDDSKLIAHDLRTKNEIWCMNNKVHEAGVTSLLCSNYLWNSKNKYQLWTGSYDDNLRIFDLRMLGIGSDCKNMSTSFKLIQKKNLNGGLWRMIPCPIKNDDKVLITCMYDGTKIVELNSKNIEILLSLKKNHESICYGADWSKDGKYITTSSFYDKIIQIWSPINKNLRIIEL